MRARFALGFLGSVATASFGVWSCIPHPTDDFEDYQERIASFQGVGGGAALDSGPPPTDAQTGLYYSACLSELANFQVQRVLSFYTKTEFTPTTGGAGTLKLTIQALKVTNSAPPPTVNPADIVGGIIPDPANNPQPAAVDASGLFTLNLGQTLVPGSANPITGSNIRIENGQLLGRFGTSRFCARLSGNLEEPTPAKRTLAGERNVCIFVPIKDGDPTPTFTPQEFSASACPP